MSDEEWLNLKAQRPKVRLCCCDSTGYLRTSKLGTKHFVHGKDRICNWAPEKWQHLLAKTEIVRVCQQFGYDAKTEVSGSDWRADVLATKTDRGQLIRLAFEVQWSPQTLEETAARQAKYQRDGIRCCWL
jgi:competence protein CoiA